MHRMRASLNSLMALPLFVAGVVGCSADAADTSGGGAGGGGSGGSVVTFGPCQPSYRSECAILQVPLDHNDAGGEAIDLHIAREGASAEATQHLWMLAGGPGQAGYVFERLVEQLHTRLPNTDIFVIDHRGTGYSHRLTCPQQDVENSFGGYALEPADVPACLQHLDSVGDLDRLEYFTIEQAARDLIFAVEQTRQADQEVFVWGGSYGTSWAHKALQLAPELMAGVVFDGYQTPTKRWFTDYDKGVEEVGQLLAGHCANDSVCAAHMGVDPFARARAIIEGLDAQPCGAIQTQFARTWASLMAGRHGLHHLFFPFLHRIERCEAGDYAPLNHMLTYVNEAFSAGNADVPFVNSGVLQYNIVLSELWHPQEQRLPTKEQLEQAAAKQLLLVGSSYPASIVALRDTWPLPPTGQDLPLPAKSEAPLLWLAGELDSRTPKSQAELVSEFYNEPKHHVVLLPGAGHTPTLSSPLAKRPDAHCGLRMVEHFVREGGEFDDSCIAALKPIQFAAATGKEAMRWWGVSDAWGDAASSQNQTRGAKDAWPAPAALPLPPSLARPQIR